MRGRKRALYIVFVIALLLPLLQMWTRWIPQPTLKGAYERHARPELTAKSWFNGEFQEAYELYFNDSVGFHPQLTRLNNMVRFKLFHESNAQNVVFGINDYLYEQDYIDAHYGTDYIGLDSIRAQVIRTKRLQDSLAAEGKTLIVFLAPSKADYLPEYIPENQRKNVTDSTNHKQFSRLLRQYGVNVIDYNTYYQSLKGKAPYPLYPQYGIHWSHYGMLQASDSLIRYIEQKRDCKLPHIVIDQYKVSHKPQFSDYDLGQVLNMAGRPLHSFPLCYPDWHWSEERAPEPLKMIAVADSYFWAPFDIGLEQRCLDGSFWYYNSSVYPASFDKKTMVSDLNIADEIEKADIILIMSTTPGLRSFSWGFIGN
ncbi:MAG: hypothetical protein K5636_08750 [Bacteroidales bacterium]|nr:hypothetical protein [Bacteroidales bacterium]